MKNFVFHIRNWNVDFFNSLEEQLSVLFPDAKFTRLTMINQVYTELQDLGKSCYYLPTLLDEEDRKQSDQKEAHEFENYLFSNHGFGMSFLFHTERYYDSIKENSSQFSYFNVLNKLVPSRSILIALTFDHFIYTLSAYVNKFKRGQNFIIQPIGFPLNSCVLLDTPWELLRFRESALEIEELENYQKSLSLDPNKAIHYMKPQKGLSLIESTKLKLKLRSKSKGPNSPHSYLENNKISLIPSRFKKIKSNYSKSSLLLEDIESLSEKSNVFYYPLQFEPEMSILSYSPYFKDQIEVIRLISQSLRMGDILLLKENPKMIGKRSQHFYDQINRYHNVLWASDVVNSRKIIGLVFKTVSITGTACIEAASMGKNSLFFGLPPFRDLLIQASISNRGINNLVNMLYHSHTSEEILAHLENQWSNFSKAVIQINTVPKYIGTRFTIPDQELVVSEVLSILKDQNLK